jgi:hemerythrin-like domain-containing protein
MIEHRLIERMIVRIKNEVQQMEKGDRVSIPFIDAAVDFIRTYADKTHHGKEEEILFKALSKKRLSAEDAGIMHELMQEHIVGRVTTAAIESASDAYQKGDTKALASLIEQLKKLVSFYPPHIKKEDAVFFPAAMKYLSQSEQESMLNAFKEFDASLIHWKYRSMVTTFQS